MPTSIDKVARDGQIVGTYSSVGGWFRRWVRDMSRGDQTFVFLDSRFLAPLVVPMKPPHIHISYLMHNIHIGGDRRWDSRSGPVYDKVIEAVDDFDAFVNLTHRQSEDIAARRGRTSNMFVVPNPVDLPPEPPVVERDPRLVSVVARLEGQKRISHAVKAFEHVVAELPDARMEIYGRGSRTDSIQRVIDRLGLGDSVKMKGHDPRARDALWRSSAFLMTSLFEGYPLSTLESFSHGCPVVSYDIKYGPREQITEGEDGFLVEAGDIRAMAARVIELLRDPALVSRMSKAARAKATQHGYDRFLSDWGTVLNASVEHKRQRTEDRRREARRAPVDRRPGRRRPGKGRSRQADAPRGGPQAHRQRGSGRGGGHPCGCSRGQRAGRRTADVGQAREGRLPAEGVRAPVRPLSERCLCAGPVPAQGAPDLAELVLADVPDAPTERIRARGQLRS